MSTKPRVDESPYITVPQLARRWHVEVKTIYNLRSAGKLPEAIKRGRQVLFPIELIERQEAADLAAEREAAQERDRQMRAPEPSHA